MIRLVRPSIGLIGRIVAILLLAVIVEFGASVVLYERASEFSVRDDEARRLAEHLVIARRLVAEQPVGGRPAMAAALSTDRYAIAWERTTLPPPPRKAATAAMYQQIVAWEPGLARADLRLRFIATGARTVIAGGVTLPDGSWLHFRTLETAGRLGFFSYRVVEAMLLAVLVMVLGGLLIRQTLRPMRMLADAADRFGAVEQPPVPELGAGEVRRVVAAFNRMQERIHRLIADRTEALAAVGHDLRTPLARLRLRADGVADAGLRDTIRGDVAEMEAMVASLLAFLGGEGDPEPPILIDIAVLCATVVDDAVDTGNDARYEGPDHLELTARPQGLKRALVNLIDNALHHGESVTVTLARDGARVVIGVEDDGPGIPEDALLRVRDPFVRLDVARKRDTVGFGLGLAIVTKVVEQEGGVFTLSNRAEGGLRAEIVLRG